jgi:hypothetical protein
MKFSGVGTGETNKRKSVSGTYFANKIKSFEKTLVLDFCIDRQVQHQSMDDETSFEMSWVKKTSTFSLFEDLDTQNIYEMVSWCQIFFSDTTLPFIYKSSWSEVGVHFFSLPSSSSILPLQEEKRKELRPHRAPGNAYDTSVDDSTTTTTTTTTHTYTHTDAEKMDQQMTAYLIYRFLY